MRRTAPAHPHHTTQQICEFDSSGRDEETPSGFSSSEEMCQMYYMVTPGGNVEQPFCFASEPIQTINSDTGETRDMMWNAVTISASGPG